MAFRGSFSCVAVVGFGCHWSKSFGVQWKRMHSFSRYWNFMLESERCMRRWAMLGVKPFCVR